MFAAALLTACGEPTDSPTSKSMGTTARKEPLLQPHDWPPKTLDLNGFGAEYPEAVKIVAGVYQPRATSNVTLIATSEGNIIVDTGIPAMPGKPSPHKAKLDRVNDKPTSHIILTHAHADHYGGTSVLFFTF
ncbi:MAG: MBL fold metallo-hydrolase [Halioglobus sp.]